MAGEQAGEAAEGRARGPEEAKAGAVWIGWRRSGAGLKSRGLQSRRGWARTRENFRSGRATWVERVAQAISHEVDAQHG